MRGDWIAVVMIEEEPTVDLAGPQLCLDCFDVGHGLVSWRGRMVSYGVPAASFSIAISKISAIATRFVRLFSPVTILAADTGSFKFPSSSPLAASFCRASFFVAA